MKQFQTEEKVHLTRHSLNYSIILPTLLELTNQNLGPTNKIIRSAMDILLVFCNIT